MTDKPTSVPLWLFVGAACVITAIKGLGISGGT